MNTQTQKAASAAAGADSNFRSLSPGLDLVLAVGLGLLALIGLAWAVQLPRLLGVTVFLQQYLGAFLGIATAAVFLTAKPHRRAGDGLPWYDAAAALAALAIGAYCVVMYPRIAYTLSVVTWDKVLFGALTVLLLLEATRRLFGLTLVILVVILCLYARFGYVLPGLLYTRGTSWERLFTYVFLDSNGIFGIALTVSATVVAAFILFGRTLQAVGGGAFFTDLAMSLMGGFRGGAAKVAVVSSTVFGTMSGSVVSNVVVSGSITIPMMQRNGYGRSLSAAVEATGSTGGQIMPPVMGVAAFIMAENLGVSYGTVALAALIPAVLYYAVLLLQVDLEARRRDLPSLPAAERPRFGPVLKKGWPFILPLALLVYTLVIANWSASRAGITAAASALLIGLVLEPRMRSLAALGRLLRDSGRILVDIAVVSALAGVVIGTLNLSGLSFTLSMVLASLAEYGILLLLVVTALTCIVFGMGMPTTVIYVLLAVMVAPALIQIGVDPMAAHMFIFYFGILSMLTPPVCMATITAATMAGAPFWQTAFLGMRLGIVGYVVPFFFVFHPGLLLQDVNGWLVVELAAATIGLGLVAVGAVGFLRARIGMVLRLCLVVGGLALAAPTTSAIGIAFSLGGLVLGLGVLALCMRSPAEPPPRPIAAKGKPG
ncbi:MAG: TRAP transporter permease [Pararhodobacter sp.]